MPKYFVERKFRGCRGRWEQELRRGVVVVAVHTQYTCLQRFVNTLRAGGKHEFLTLRESEEIQARMSHHVAHITTTQLTVLLAVTCLENVLLASHHLSPSQLTPQLMYRAHPF